MPKRAMKYPKHNSYKCGRFTKANFSTSGSLNVSPQEQQELEQNEQIRMLQEKLEKDNPIKAHMQQLNNKDDVHKQLTERFEALKEQLELEEQARKQIEELEKQGPSGIKGKKDQQETSDDSENGQDGERYSAHNQTAETTTPPFSQDTTDVTQTDYDSSDYYED